MPRKPCTICGSTEPSHVHNTTTGETIPDYFTVGRGETDLEAALRWQRRALVAERVCVMVGWTPASDSDRGKALHELWAEWVTAYEIAGGSIDPAAHPDLSDERIAELAARRDATRAATMQRIAEAGLIVEVPA